MATMVKAWVVLYTLYGALPTAKPEMLISSTHDGCILNIQIAEIYDIGTRISRCFVTNVPLEEYKSQTDPEYLPPTGTTGETFDPSMDLPPLNAPPLKPVAPVPEPLPKGMVCDDILKRAGLCTP